MDFAYVNNQMVSKVEVKIRLEGRGYQFGGGVYEDIWVFIITPLLK